MKKHARSRQPGTRGGALVWTLFVALLLVGLSGALAFLILSQTRESLSEETRARTFYTAEAGISASLAEIRSGADPGGDGLGTVSGSFAGGTYQVTAVETEPQQEWVLDAAATQGLSTRRFEVVVRAQPSGSFQFGLFSDEDMRLTGDMRIDSYDSRNGTYASQATHTYPPTGLVYARANGDVGSNHAIRVDGDAVVLGDASPGPGHAVAVHGNAHVGGSTSPLTEPVPLPPPPYAPAGPALGPFLLGSSGTHTFASGTYHYTSFETTGSSTTTFQGSVRLYVDGLFRSTASSTLVLAPGSQLAVYHLGEGSGIPGSGAFEITGQGIVNQDGLPANFLLYSATSDQVRISGQADFYGAIYAPGGRVRITGTSVSYGSFVGRTVEVTGGAQFHYDEALAQIPGQGPPLHLVRSWREVGIGAP